MTQAERIATLAALLEGTGIGLLELTTPDGTLRLRRNAGRVTAEPTAQPVTVTAPAPGHFRSAHPSLDGPLAAAGVTVAAGQSIGLVQAGSLLMHVPAPVAGTVQAVLANDGDLVGYGSPLLQMTEDRG